MLVIDDQALLRAGLVRLLAEDPRIEVGEAGNGIEALAQIGKLKPDVVLMDVKMPELDGIEATSRITAEHPASRSYCYHLRC